MRGSLLVASCVLLGTFVASDVLADSVTLTADTYTNAAASSSNFGKKKQIWVQSPSAGGGDDGYLLFDLSTLPFGTVGSDVAVATLTLGVGKVRSAGSFDVFRVLGSNAGDWTETGLTSGNAPSLANTPEASDVTVARTDQSGFKAVDVTALVRDWLDGNLPNNGLALVPHSGSPLSAAFDSKETTTTAHYARLDITLGAVSSFSGPLNGDVTGGQTATRVARINGSPLASLGGASIGQALTFFGSSWGPGNVVTSLLAGTGLSLSASNGDVTVSIPTGAVTNGLLANSSITLGTGTGLSGGGSVPLGGTLSLLNTGVLSLSALSPLSVTGGQTPTLSLLGAIPIANGGTGATTLSGALTSLGAAGRGANGDITSLTALTTPLSVAQGGTGAANVSGALTSLGAAGRGANSDITSLAALSTPLSVAQGGTGAANVAGALTNLGGASRGANADITSLAALTTPLSVGQGGTGAVSVAGALSSLGAASRGANGDITSLAALTTPLSVGQGGTGASSVAGALATLGAAARGANTDITSLDGLATPLSVAQGGTGSNSASAALGSLGGAARGANSDITSLAALSTPLSVAQGGTGSNSAGAALSALGGAARGANADITSMTGLTGVNGTILSLLTSLPVYVTPSGTLGVVGSSVRFKHDVVDMGKASDGLLRLRPVRFRYNKDIDPTGQEQYGLIAEEVARVYPDLVANDADGRPLTVRYQALTPMLLNELQRQAHQIDEQHRQLEAQTELLRTQAAQLNAVTSRLERIEASMRQEPRATEAKLSHDSHPPSPGNPSL